MQGKASGGVNVAFLRVFVVSELAELSGLAVPKIAIGDPRICTLIQVLDVRVLA